jgi:2,3-bisphosphoglycerate-independent phosphoglycerate mutase
LAFRVELIINVLSLHLNSHLNIGAGRIVWQDIVRIDVSIKKRQFHKSKNIVDSCNRAKEGNGRLHLLGLVSEISCCLCGETIVAGCSKRRGFSLDLYCITCLKVLTPSPPQQVSDGGVHSHITHLYALLETAKELGVPHTYVHFLGDGRDTAPRSAAGYCRDLLEFMKKEEYGELATVIGRYYAMDRDKRWERVKIAVDGLVGGVGEKVEGADEGVIGVIEENYKKDVTDEFLKPIIVNGDEGRIKGGCGCRACRDV